MDAKNQANLFFMFLVDAILIPSQTYFMNLDKWKSDKRLFAEWEREEWFLCNIFLLILAWSVQYV